MGWLHQRNGDEHGDNELDRSSRKGFMESWLLELDVENLFMSTR